jgi:hypothetical protein
MLEMKTRERTVRVFDLRERPAPAAAPPPPPPPKVVALAKAPEPPISKEERRRREIANAERRQVELANAKQREIEKAEARRFLAETWPALFAGDPVPLPIGMTDMVYAEGRTKGGLSNRLCKRAFKALCWRCASRAYLTAVAADGAMRRNVEGEPVEPVSERDRQHALERLAAQDARASPIKEGEPAP